MRVAHSLIASILVVLGSSTFARASEIKGPLYVLEIDSEDLEDVAHPMTLAMQERARSLPGVELKETPQTFSILSAAFRCGAKPDDTCLERIAKHLQTDQFVWGVVRKRNGYVSVEVHLFRKGEPDVQMHDSYPDSQKEVETPKRGKRLLEKLVGIQLARVTVQAADYGCPVLVDGERVGSLEKGRLVVEMRAGTHRIGLAQPCKSTSRLVAVKQDMALDLMANDALSNPHADDSSMNARALVGWSSLGVGVASTLVGGFFGIRYQVKRGEIQDKLDRGEYGAKGVATGVRPEDSGKPVDCANYPGTSSGVERACQDRKDMNGNIVPGLVFAGAGVVLVGAGAVLLLTGKDDAKKGADKEGLRVIPMFGSRNGLLLQGVF